MPFRVDMGVDIYFLTQKKGLSKTAESPVSLVAGPTRLELATSGVTGRRSNQLNYDPALLSSRWWAEQGLNL
jgi:hypothetical protein